VSTGAKNTDMPDPLMESFSAMVLLIKRDPDSDHAMPPPPADAELLTIRF